MKQTIPTICRICKKSFERPVQRGRPAVKCEKCRTQDPLVKAILDIPDIGDEEITSLTHTEETVQKIDCQEASMQSSKSNPEPISYPYHVTVSNLGLAYGGDDESAALQAFNSYCKKSNMGFGQVGFERVQLWRLNQEINEYQLLKDFVPDRAA